MQVVDYYDEDPTAMDRALRVGTIHPVGTLLVGLAVCYDTCLICRSHAMGAKCRSQS